MSDDTNIPQSEEKIIQMQENLIEVDENAKQTKNVSSQDVGD